MLKLIANNWLYSSQMLEVVGSSSSSRGSRSRVVGAVVASGSSQKILCYTGLAASSAEFVARSREAHKRYIYMGMAQ